jgi:hypothetical protein
VAEDKKKKRNLFGILSGGFSPKELRKRKKLSANQKRELAKKQPKPELNIHSALDLVGRAPLVGEPADILNAALYWGKGDKSGALWSLLGALPVLGNLRVGRRPPIGIHAFRGIQEKPVLRKGQLPGGERYGGSVYLSESPLIGSGYAQSMKHGKMAEKHVAGAGWAPDDFMNKPIPGLGSLIELDIDPNFMDLYARGGKMWPSYGRFEYSGGQLMQGAKEMEIFQSIPDRYIREVYKAEDIIRRQLPELGRYAR